MVSKNDKEMMDSNRDLKRRHKTKAVNTGISYAIAENESACSKQTPTASETDNLRETALQSPACLSPLNPHLPASTTYPTDRHFNDNP